MLARQARTTRDLFRSACLATAIAVIGVAAPFPAAATGSDPRSCFAGASPAPHLDPAQRHSASNRVLSLVARNLGAFAVDISFDGPLESNAVDRQVEIMRSVARELDLPGAAEAD
jgi:hypothetical protein